VGFENVLGRALGPVTTTAASTTVGVLLSRDDELDAWVDVVTTGFVNPDEQGVPSHEDFPARSSSGLNGISSQRECGIISRCGT
jgi:hypothetical protein